MIFFLYPALFYSFIYCFPAMFVLILPIVQLVPFFVPVSRVSFISYPFVISRSFSSVPNLGHHFVIFRGIFRLCFIATVFPALILFRAHFVSLSSLLPFVRSPWPRHLRELATDTPFPPFPILSSPLPLIFEGMGRRGKMEKERDRSGVNESGKRERKEGRGCGPIILRNRSTYHLGCTLPSTSLSNR